MAQPNGGLSWTWIDFEHSPPPPFFLFCFEEMGNMVQERF